MKTKLIVSSLTALVLSVGILLTASAGWAQQAGRDPQRAPQMDIQKVPLKLNPQIVYLKCEPSKSDVAALVKVTNNTSQALPQGTLIVAKNQKGLQTNYTVGSGGMKPNANVVVTLGGSWTDSSPCSAYAKK